MDLLDLQKYPEIQAVVAQLRAKAEGLGIDGKIILHPAELWIDTFSGRTTARVVYALTDRSQARAPGFEPETLSRGETTFEVAPPQPQGDT